MQFILLNNFIPLRLIYSYFCLLFRGQGFRLRALFKAGLDIDVVNEYGQSALFLAAANGHSRTVALLISMGALRISDNAGVYINFTNVDPNSLDWMENEKEIIIAGREEQKNGEGVTGRINIIKEKEVITKGSRVEKEIRIIKYELKAPCLSNDLQHRLTSLSIIYDEIKTGTSRSIPKNKHIDYCTSSP